MKQIICNSAGALIARMPRPVAQHGQVLVHVRYSMVSVGTELASLRPAPHPTLSVRDQVKNATSLASHYLGKAIRHPDKALRKMKSIAERQLHRARERLHPPAEARRPAPDSMAWVANNARSFENASGRLAMRLTSDTSEFGYQATLGPVTIPEGFWPLVQLRGTLRGGEVGMGITDGVGSAWLTTKTYPQGTFSDELACPAATGSFKLIVSNVGSRASVELDLDEVEISFLPRDDANRYHADTDDTGWNVGYSAAGEVVACGLGVTGFAVGDVVACCGAGIANHAEYISVPQNLACRLPAGCALREAATATVGSIALQGVRRAAPSLGERIAVIGLGLIGQMTAQLLTASGCTVLGMDLDSSRVERAKALGMSGGASSPEEFQKLVLQSTSGVGPDKVVITAATKSNAPLNLAMQIVREKGTVVIVGDVGLCPERPAFYRKEVNLLMSTSYGAGRYDRSYEAEGRDYPLPFARWTIKRNMQAFLEQIAAGRLSIDKLIDREVDVTQAPAAYKELAEAEGPLPLGVLLRYPSQAEEDEPVITLRGHRPLTDAPVKYALVGAGAFGTSMLAPQMARHPKIFQQAGVVSADAVRGGNYARAQGVPYLGSDPAAMAAREDIDLLVVATRHDQHARTVIAALAAGKHVFVEKPLATTWDELRLVDEAWRQSRALANPPLVMVGFNRRFSPAVQALQAALAGRSGPLQILYRLNGGFIAASHWIQTSEGGGRNIGEACHMYDVFRALSGAPVCSIQAAAVAPNGTRLQNDNFSACLTYDDGSQSTLTYTALGPKAGLPKERIEIFCDGEAYVIDDYRKLTRCSDGSILWEGDVDKGHARELALLGDALTSSGEAPIPFDEIVETTAVSLHIEDILHGRATAWEDATEECPPVDEGERHLA
ncbi:oxidoreductase domain protein [Desulfovibrio sp. X2]|uniref:bi-domain-containing oxidoreductase n=1 Tax=Desulfovibrio sp. X2 TaxID=941449 RepID=UPI000358A3DA|nr:bi-domain-containing oxidoreductase [Desulfovibrio sp. X2]EPR37135.1 oxidoreductase domain protein [Desulfovibrio sp. X2]